MEKEELEELKKVIKEGFKLISQSIKQSFEAVRGEIRESKNLLSQPTISIQQLENEETPRIEKRFCKECWKEFESLDGESLLLIQSLIQLPNHRLPYYVLCKECRSKHWETNISPLSTMLKSKLKAGMVRKEYIKFVRKCIKLLEEVGD